MDVCDTCLVSVMQLWQSSEFFLTSRLTTDAVWKSHANNWKKIIGGTVTTITILLVTESRVCPCPSVAVSICFVRSSVFKLCIGNTSGIKWSASLLDLRTWIRTQRYKWITSLVGFKPSSLCILYGCYWAVNQTILFFVPHIPKPSLYSQSIFLQLELLTYASEYKRRSGTYRMEMTIKYSNNVNGKRVDEPHLRVLVSLTRIY